MRLYRYRPINEFTFESIEKSELYLSNAIDFNDPLDSTYEIFDKKLYQERFNQYLKKIIKTKEQNDFISVSLKVALEEEIFKIQHNCLNQKICCFSISNDNMLMWSHYADSHKGICLIFDSLDIDKFTFLPINKESLNFDNMVAIKDFSGDYIGMDEIPNKYVNYPVHRVRYTDKMISSINYIDNEWFSFILAKTTNWEYEKEYRLSIDVRQIKSNPIEFDKKCLKGIIFGVNSSFVDINRIKLTCDLCYDNINYYKAVMKDRKLNIVDLNNS